MYWLLASLGPYPQEDKVLYVQAISSAATKESWLDSPTGKISILLLTALAGFMSSYLLERIKRRNQPHKQLSWEISSEQGLVSVSPSIREQVQILFRDNHVENLHAYNFRVTNSGNTVVKNQYIRFQFSASTTILEHGPDTSMPRELGMELIANPVLPPHEIRYLIRHLEVSQEAKILFLVAGSDVQQPVPYPLNEEGDVRFVRRDIAKVTEDAEHIRPFIIWGFSFIVFPLMAGELIFDSSLAGLLEGALRIAFFVPMSIHIAPVARMLQRALAAIASSKSGGAVDVAGNALVLVGEYSQVYGGVAFGAKQGQADDSST